MVLVAQALECEVESRKQTSIDINRIICTLRTLNLLMLILVNSLILTGVGQYNSNQGGKRSLMLTPNMWQYSLKLHLPITFTEMNLIGQYVACIITITIFLITFIIHAIHLCSPKNSRLLSIAYSFGSVPFALMVFGLEMHYSTCPWLNDFYRKEILRKDFNTVEPYFDAQCAINGWALAGVFSLLSCIFFISEGLAIAFFRSNNSNRIEKNSERNDENL
ncbi:unnamed protein product [Dracunculus medinensis]|uniref:MARVEL domain-containing protein n=1 Tax=Dracunculus medinensis TaxID=318479 RepID=A0A3P7SPT6_DRAME|nr:unnamed protein product [Dracunculus medinensis]